MIILTNLLGYLLIGTVFTFCVDMINELLKNRKKRFPKLDYTPPTDKDWGIAERITSIILWPFAMYVFLMAFIKSKNE
tara:strand:+ start:548 stop:781 length:234 start_codon:yes stop_codon:yes gene_type:complete